jgi:hypothetical protein
MVGDPKSLKRVFLFIFTDLDLNHSKDLAMFLMLLIPMLKLLLKSA